MRIDIGDQSCEICGRHVSDFRRKALQRTYTCPGCEHEACPACFYEHSCGRRVCASCLARSGLRKGETDKVVGRSGILGQHHHTYQVTFFEHTWRTGSCSCGRKDKWYSVQDLILLGASWKQVDDLDSY
ncbi:hypothetical protein JXD38_05010 [candidate division WOR-3 bacterium]|nr:hypothetical protein [candidate division WOR-3 bacterium]